MILFISANAQAPSVPIQGLDVIAANGLTYALCCPTLPHVLITSQAELSLGLFDFLTS